MHVLVLPSFRETRELLPQAAGEENLAGKVLVDVSNPLNVSHGLPGSLFVCNTDSLGEQLQRRFPQARVVKALNTMNCRGMVDPSRVPAVRHGTLDVESCFVAPFPSARNRAAVPGGSVDPLCRRSLSRAV